MGYVGVARVLGWVGGVYWNMYYSIRSGAISEGLHPQSKILVGEL